MRHPRGLETLAIVLLFSGSVASGYAFVFGSALVNSFSINGKRVGKLLSEESGVRFKPRSAAIWREVSKNSVLDVSGGDSVHTGSGITTAVRLEHGPVVEIGPESLVVFKSFDRHSGPALKVAYGHVRLKF